MADAPDLLSPPDFSELVSERHLALFLDFDGTLVEIASAPDAIAVPPDLSARLSGLAARLDGRLALVTGRSPDDLASYCPFDGIACAGSHGAVRFSAEGGLIGEEPEGLPAAAIARLREMARAPRLGLEEKTHGVALHFRAAPEQAAAARDVAEAVAREYGLTVKPGKCVIELVRPGADKGGAVRDFMQVAPFAGAMPVFIGDDLTDEDGFAACEALGGWAIVVGDRKPTAARYRLRSVAHVYEWLGL